MGKDNKAIVEAWNTYFEKSYDQRYHYTMLPRNVWVLEQEATRYLEKTSNSTLRILDFGCGSGRCFAFVEQYAKKYPGITIEVLAYDPACEGLKRYSEHLTKKFFTQTDGPDISDRHKEPNPDGQKGYRAFSMKKGNITVNFVHGDVNDTLEYIKSIIGEEFGLTTAMFGVLSYIPGKENRQNTLAMFRQITANNGSIVMTHPTRTRFLDIQAKYKAYRADPANHMQDLGLAVQEGDIYYEREGGKVKNYYHLYDTSDLQEDLDAAHLPSQIQVSNIGDMKTLVDNPILSRVDEYASWLTPRSWVDCCATDSLSISRVSR